MIVMGVFTRALIRDGAARIKFVAAWKKNKRTKTSKEGVAPPYLKAR
jgi:hypothetical protein